MRPLSGILSSYFKYKVHLIVQKRKRVFTTGCPVEGVTEGRNKMEKRTTLDIDLFCEVLGQILSHERGTVVTVTATPKEDKDKDGKES